MKTYPTPRTDEESFSTVIQGEIVSAKFAREIERENAEILDAISDPVRVHAMMMRRQIAWNPIMLRHLLGDNDLLDMLIRCEGWFATLPEGRKMQLECQRVISAHTQSTTL
jgi:hypothetical protein